MRELSHRHGGVHIMTILYPSLGSSELQPYEAPFGRMMLAYGRDRESGFPRKVMSALPPKADMCGANGHVCFGPKADICSIRS
jgi:hypothetical protein